MSQLDEVQAIAADNTAGVFRLSAETLAVLFFAQSWLEDIENWKDFSDEPLSRADQDTIREMVDSAYDEITRAYSMIPVGATMMWHTNAPPARWLLCTGGLAYKSEYPELYALWGDKYGDAGDQFGIVDMRDRSPMGADGGFVSLDQDKGALTHTLTVAQIPPHAHRVQKQSATANAGVNTVTPAARTDNTAAPHVMTDETGGGAAHNNVHPVKGVYWIVYGGL